MTPPDTYDAGKNYSDSWELTHQTIRKRGMMTGKYLPEDERERSFLDWEVQ